MTAAQRAENALGYAQLNKPMVAGYGAQIYDPRTHQFISSPNTLGATLQPPNPQSTSLIAQTGLSQAALDWLTKGVRPRGQQQYNAIQQEISDYSRKTGVDTATLEAQAKGYNNILTNNVQRNNQGQILENEIQGSIRNVAPLANAIGNGQISAANLANVWAGGQVNDPVVAQYKDQLLRLRGEIAGYNAVAAGKLTENGTARVDEGDLRQAEAIISNGINSGGLQGLASSIGMSTAKNRVVLQGAIDDANQGMWNLFGVGQNYKRSTPPSFGAVAPGGMAGAPAGKTVVRTGTENGTGRKVIQYSDGSVAYAP